MRHAPSGRGSPVSERWREREKEGQRERGREGEREGERGPRTIGTRISRSPSAITCNRTSLFLTHSFCLLGCGLCCINANDSLSLSLLLPQPGSFQLPLPPHMIRRPQCKSLPLFAVPLASAARAECISFSGVTRLLVLLVLHFE